MAKQKMVFADPVLRRRWLNLAGLYVVLLICLEPLIDFVLMQQPLERSHEAIAALNEKKHYITTVSFCVMRSLPIMLFFWFGLKVLSEMRLPPKGMRMPVTTPVLEGAVARNCGMVMVAVALMLLLRELSILTSV